jgi:hypothetical protein
MKKKLYAALEQRSAKLAARKRHAACTCTSKQRAGRAPAALRGPPQARGRRRLRP